MMIRCDLNTNQFKLDKRFGAFACVFAAQDFMYKMMKHFPLINCVVSKEEQVIFVRDCAKMFNQSIKDAIRKRKAFCLMNNRNGLAPERLREVYRAVYQYKIINADTMQFGSVGDIEVAFVTDEGGDSIVQLSETAYRQFAPLDLHILRSAGFPLTIKLNASKKSFEASSQRTLNLNLDVVVGAGLVHPLDVVGYIIGAKGHVVGVIRYKNHWVLYNSLPETRGVPSLVRPVIYYSKNAYLCLFTGDTAFKELIEYITTELWPKDASYQCTPFLFNHGSIPIDEAALAAETQEIAGHHYELDEGACDLSGTPP
jgi:hypothetical protein